MVFMTFVEKTTFSFSHEETEAGLRSETRNELLRCVEEKKSKGYSATLTETTESITLYSSLVLDFKHNIMR